MSAHPGSPIYRLPTTALALSAGCALLSSSLVQGGWPFAKRKPCPPVCSDMHVLSEEAAHSVQLGLSLQVRNGEILSRTLRPHHFEFAETTDETTLETKKQLVLHASGKGELERVARRQLHRGFVEIYVEATHNPAFVGTPQEIKEANDQRDAQQAQLVTDYLQQCLGCPTVTVMLIDTPQVGLEGVEGMAAFRRGLRSFTSTIPGSQFNRAGGDASGMQFGGGSGFGGGTSDNSLFLLPGQPNPTASFGMPSF